MQNGPDHHQHIGANASGRRGVPFETVGDHVEFLQSSVDDGETAERPADAHPVSISGRPLSNPTPHPAPYQAHLTRDPRSFPQRDNGGQTQGVRATAQAPGLRATPLRQGSARPVV